MYKVSHCVYPIIFLHWKFNSFREISFLNFTVMHQFIIRCVTIIWPFYMLVLSGCAGWSTVKYPKPILLDGAADVSVQYSHDHISIHVPLQIPGDRPTALQVKIFHHSDSVDPSLEHLFFPDDNIQLYLPEPLFSTGDTNHTALITPMGGDFPPIRRSFEIPPSGRVEIPTVLIEKRPVIVTGQCFYRPQNSIITGVQVLIETPQQKRFTSVSDSSGKYRFELPEEILTDSLVQIVVQTTDSTGLWSQALALQNEKYHRVDISLGPSESFVRRGVLYRVLKPLSPFRSGPENGAPIQFMLSKGDIIAVEAVAGDRLRGWVEIVDEDQTHSQTIQGWILKKDVELMPQ